MIYIKQYVLVTDDDENLVYFQLFLVYSILIDDLIKKDMSQKRGTKIHS